MAFNAQLLRHALADEGLSAATRQAAIDNVACHEYGHALSSVLATPAMKATGPRLLELLPPGLRRAIDYPGTYRRVQVFDDVIANVYALMTSRAESLRPFHAIVPWPP